MKRLNVGIYPSDFSSVYKTVNRKFKRLKKNFGHCFGLLWYLAFGKISKNNPISQKGKRTRVMGMSGELSGMWGVALTIKCMKANGLSITEIVVTGVTQREPTRGTLGCPVFQSPLLLYLFRGASGKWSAYNCRCSTSH